MDPAADSAAPDIAEPYEQARRAQRGAIARRRRRSGRATRQAGAPSTPAAWAVSPSQRRGHAAEQRAADYLGTLGVRVLAHNLRCKAGEIDLLALDGDTLAFIEVRSRRSARFGGAAASVNRSKQQRLLRAAQCLLPHLGPRYLGKAAPACRFDVIALDQGRIEWLKAAFIP